MNKKSMNEIVHATRLEARGSSSRSINVSNLGSDEDSVLVSKLIIELYTSIMSISE
jgi:hypothetical protein